MIHGTGKQVGVSYAEEEGHEQQYSGKARSWEEAFKKVHQPETEIGPHHWE
jgi:hypothetical protein